MSRDGVADDSQLICCEVTLLLAVIEWGKLRAEDREALPSVEDLTRRSPGQSGTRGNWSLFKLPKDGSGARPRNHIYVANLRMSFPEVQSLPEVRPPTVWLVQPILLQPRSGRKSARSDSSSSGP
jgi:hypothetical protein